MSPALSILILLGAEAIALKEKVTVSGRWVRIIDLVDADRTDPATRARMADLYVGRAPEEGQTRTIFAEEIRRELERRGIDLGSVIWAGESVEVSRGVSADTESLRRAVLRELEKHVGAATIKLLSLDPETCPGGGRVVTIEGTGPRFVATLSDGTTIDVVARVLRMREAVFAARDLAPGRLIDRSDLELRRVEATDDERLLDLGTAVGSVLASRVRMSSPITPADLKMRAVVRKGDLVRAVSSDYEVDARALEDGVPGQEIGLEFASSRNRIRAKVVDPTRVTVVEASR
ncbi:MAG TPA: flagellar basal body P-ring formation chaperone FlgA [Planctomycetota bacterium]|nr:flagellar basal body P-ring formation chaperone FlgA [Planctomycetota bacterium]